MSDYIIMVDRARVIRALGDPNGNGKYVNAIKAITRNMATNSELISAASLSSFQYSEMKGKGVASENTLDVVLERLSISRQKIFHQCMNDFEYVNAVIYTDNLIRFCFELSGTIFNSEYNVCKQRYVEHTKVDVIRSRMGIRKSTVCTMAADEIHFVLMLYAVARASAAPMADWNARFELQTLRYIVTHPERLTIEERSYINFEELKEYAERRK